MKKRILLSLFFFSFSSFAQIQITSGLYKDKIFSSQSSAQSFFSGCVQVRTGYYDNYYKDSSPTFSSGTITLQGGLTYADSACSQAWSSGKSFTITFQNYECPPGTTLVDGVCKNQCENLAGNSTTTSWDYFNLGDNPRLCSNSCELTTSLTLCFLNSGSCSGTATISGNTCEQSEAGGNIPDQVPQGCEQISGIYLCPEDSSGDGQPDSGQPLDPSAKCGYNDKDKFVCYGGSYADEPYEMKDPTKPLQGVESGPVNKSDVSQEIVNQPDAPTLESDEREQIKKLNEQINVLLTGLNEDNNTNFKKVIDELKDNNEFNQSQLDQIVAGTNKQIEIWNELKTLEIQGTQDTINAINQLDDYDQYYHDQMMQKQNQLLSALKDLSTGNGSESINEIRDAITNTDATLDVTGSAYVSQHTTESLSNEMVTRIGLTRDAIYDGMLSAFADIDLSNASKPSFALDMSGFGFGSYDLESYINLDYVFSFIRICILFTAALTCRKLIFGG